MLFFFYMAKFNWFIFFLLYFISFDFFEIYIKIIFIEKKMYFNILFSLSFEV